MGWQRLPHPSPASTGELKEAQTMIGARNMAGMIRGSQPASSRGEGCKATSLGSTDRAATAQLNKLSIRSQTQSEPRLC